MNIKNLTTDAKVGLFVLIILVILAYITIDVSNLAISPGGSYMVYTLMNNAEGVTKKTPVQVAGIPVGSVSSIELKNGRQAFVGLQIKKDVVLHQGVQVQLRIRGVLGDTFIELIQGPPDAPPLEDGAMIAPGQAQVQYQDVFESIGDITKDLKEITEALKEYTVTDQSRLSIVLKNMEVMTTNLANFSNKNVQNMDSIVSNLAALTEDLRRISGESGEEVEVALKRINEITDKINSGKGTLGQLVSDDTTIEKANEILNNVSDITRTYSSMKTEIGYHLEYLARAGDAKNYVDIKIKPRPDKFFMFGVNYDPNPPPSTSNETQVIGTNGTVTTVNTTTDSFNTVRFSAQLGKKFHDFTVRGGLIESTGGFGIEYNKGPVAVKFEMFDFGSSQSGPHMKAMTELNVTKSLYLLGGIDDFANGDQGPDYFFGAGIRLTDDDIKALFSGAAAVISR